jgi:hypothetical protein
MLRPFLCLVAGLLLAVGGFWWVLFGEGGTVRDDLRGRRLDVWPFRTIGIREAIPAEPFLGCWALVAGSAAGGAALTALLLRSGGAVRRAPPGE